MTTQRTLLVALLIGAIAAVVTVCLWEPSRSSSPSERNAGRGSDQSESPDRGRSRSLPVRPGSDRSSSETASEAATPSNAEGGLREGIEETDRVGVEFASVQDAEYSRDLLQRWTRSDAKGRRLILEEIANLDDPDLAASLLNEILTTSNPAQKKAALLELLDLAPEMAADAAAVLLQDEDRSVRRAAVKTLASAGDGSHVQPLVQANRSWCGETAFDTVFCARTLDRLGHSSAASELAERQARDSGSDDDQDRLESMKRATYDGDINLCVAGTGDAATGVRLQALYCLVQIGGPPELEILEQLGETKVADTLRSNLDHGRFPGWWDDIHGSE